jgi:hypothetical protein
MTPQPPRRAERLARWSLAPWERAAVLGDLAEEFHAIEATRGHRAARRWYWRQTIVSIWPNVLRRVQRDERRQKQLRHCAQNMLFGVSMLALYYLADRNDPRRASTVFGIPVVVCYASLLLGAGVQAAAALFSERVEMARSQRRVRAGLATVLLALLCLSLISPPSLAWQWLGGYALLFLVVESLRLWPRWRPDPAPAVFSVGSKGERPLTPDAQVLTSVPNKPLGMSDLLLLHPAASGTRPEIAWQRRSLVQRTFREAQSFRVCAIVKVEDRPSSAIVDLVGESGQVVRGIDVPLRIGDLGAVPPTWDDAVDADNTAAHFAEIDGRVDLQGLTPGRYAVRLTVTDGEHVSVREESIQVR